MYNPITKFARYLRREYPEISTFGLGFGAFGLVGATIGVVASGGSLLIIPAVTLGMGGLTGLISLPMGESGRRGDNSGSLNGAKIVGSPRDVDSILMVQRLIDGVTEKKKHLQELPPRTARKIARHVADVQGALSRLRIYTGYTDQPASTFAFTREVIDASGKTVKQPVATVEIALLGSEAKTTLKLPAAKPAPARPAPAPVPVPPPAPAAAGPDLKAEFSTLAKKMGDVEKRVGELENPLPASLDKPKLHKPA